MTTTYKKFEGILREEGASCALLEQVEARPGLDLLAAQIRCELGIRSDGARRPSEKDRRRYAAAIAANEAAMADSLAKLQAKWA